MIMPQLKKQQGLSLIEFMVAGLIGLILILGLTQIFVSNRQAFDTTTASANVQETGRMATEILSKAIRNADYWGCADLSRMFNNLDDSSLGFNADVLGFGSGLDGADDYIDTTASPVVKDGTDFVVVRGARGSDIQLSGAMNNSSAVMDVTSVGALAIGDIIGVSDCRGGDIFQVTKLPPGGTGKIQHNTGDSVSPGNGKNVSGCGSANCFSQIYDTGASILMPFSERYFVGIGVSGEPALFLGRGLLSGASVGGTQSIELVDGVEDMQILYGEDTNGDGTVNAYRTAAAVSDMNDVLSVRISLLARSRQANVVDSTQTLTFNGAAVDGSDLRLRRVYTMTSTIRNRM